MTFTVGYGGEGADATKLRRELADGTFVLQFSSTVTNTGSGAQPSALFLEAYSHASFMTRSSTSDTTASSTGRKYLVSFCLSFIDESLLLGAKPHASISTLTLLRSMKACPQFWTLSNPLIPDLRSISASLPLFLFLFPSGRRTVERSEGDGEIGLRYLFAFPVICISYIAACRIIILFRTQFECRCESCRVSYEPTARVYLSVWKQAIVASSLFGG